MLIAEFEASVTEALMDVDQLEGLAICINRRASSS